MKPLHQFMAYKLLKMILTKFIPILVLAFLLLKRAESGTASPTWTGTNLIQAGTRIIILNSNQQNGSNLYIHTYSPTFASTPFTALGLIGFQTTSLYEYLIKFWVNIADYTSTTQMKINMTQPTATSWRHFRLSYIAIDPVFNQLKVDYFYQNSLTNVSTGSKVRSYQGVFTLNIGPVDITHQISIIPLLIGLQSRSVNGEHCVFWDTKLNNANSIRYNLTVDRTTQISFFVSYILVVDRTLASNTLEIFMDELYIGGVDNTPVYQTPVYYNITNMHAGVNSFRFQLFAFSFDKSSFLLSTIGSYKFINISIWSYRQRSCNPTYPYYELTTNLCYDTCPAGYVDTNGNTGKYCKSCDKFITACQLCSPTGSSCTKCFGNYAISGGGSSCTCPNGFYTSSTYTSYLDKCRSCDNSCLTCSGPNNNQCLSCLAGKTLSSGSCICSFGTSPLGGCFSSCRDQACTQCPTNSSLCQTCKPTFTLTGARCSCGVDKYYDGEAVTCASCHYSCLYCSGPSNTQCTYCNSSNFRYLETTNECLCMQGYIESGGVCTLSANNTSCSTPGYYTNPFNGQCQQICGDSIMINSGCDDGNANDGDGCSSTCAIQPGFVCSSNQLAPNKQSFCSYGNQITITLNETKKDIFANKLHMNYKLQPNLAYVLSAYTDLTSNLAFSPADFNMIVQKATYNPQYNSIEVEATYGASVQDQNVTVTLTIPQTALTYAVPVSSTVVKIQPTNKFSATYYDDNQYLKIMSLKVLGMICYVGGIVLSIFLAFFRKMIGLEYAIMAQFIYFSIMLSTYSHSYFGSIQEWEYVNGYNDVNVTITDAKYVDNSFANYGYYDYFFINFNAMLFAILVNYLLALMLYGLSLISDRSTQRKLRISAIFFAAQIGFNLVVFSLNNIILSIFLQALAGHIFQFKYGLNKFFLVLTILIVIGQIGIYVKKIHDFNDSQLYYHRNKNHTHYFPLVFLARNLVLTSCIVLSMYDKSVASFIGFGIQIGYIIAHLAVRPFKRLLDYIRFMIIQLTLTLMLASHLVQINFITDYSSMDAGMAGFFQVSAIFVFVGMFLGLIMTIVSFAYHFWKYKTQNIQVNPDAPEEEVQGQDQVYVPPVQIQGTKDKFRLQSSQQSKQLILVQDLQQGVQQNTGAAGSQNFNFSLYDKDSRRRLRSKKINKVDKDFH